MIPILYYTKTDEKPFNSKVAFIFLVSNLFGPDLVALFFIIPTHNILGFTILAIPLSLFFSYYSRFSIEKSGKKFLPLKIVDDGISEVNWKNSYCITVAGGISHFFIDQFFHWEKEMHVWPGIDITHDQMLAWNGSAYHAISPLMIIGDVVVISILLISLYCFRRGYKSTFILLLIASALTVFLMVMISTTIFWAEREFGGIIFCFIYILIPLFLLMYAARDVRDNPIETPDLPKIKRKNLLKIVALISILFALFMILYSYFAITSADYLASLVEDDLEGDISSTILFIGYLYLFLALILLIASIGLFFKINICRYIVITICMYFFIFAFPLAIALFLYEKDVKKLFGKEESED